MEFYTKWKRPEKVYEKGGGECLVDKAGYVSAKKRIENLMMAGQRLLASRREMYDFPDGEIDENAWDPTRSKNFDLADGTQLAMQVDERLKAAKIRHDDAVKASQNDQEGSGKVLKDEKAPE